MKYSATLSQPTLRILAWGVLATLQLCFVVLTVVKFFEYGYLPQPFISDKHDTFMDFFHVLFWSGHYGRYSEWNSVYPPLVFCILRPIFEFIYLSSQYSNSFDLRGSVSGITLSIMFVLISFVSNAYVFRIKLYNSLSIQELFFAGVFFLLSSVTLFAIERGNLIVFTPILLAVVIVNDGWLRALFIAIMINIKPYFVLLLLMYIIKYQYIWFARSFLIAGIIFLITGMIVDENFQLFLYSLVAYGSGNLIYAPESILSMDSSMTVFSYVEEWKQAYDINPFLNKELSQILSLAIRYFNFITIFICLIGLFMSRSKITEDFIIATIIIILNNLSYTFGGYILILYIPIFPIMFKMRHRKTLVFLILLLFMPIDLFVIDESNYHTQDVYLSGKIVQVALEQGLGSILRPLINFMILLTLGVEVWEIKTGSLFSFNKVSSRVLFMFRVLNY